MAALDFPASPTLDQTYTANGSTWKWNGTSWVTLTSSGFINATDDTTSTTLYPVMVAAAGSDQSPKVTTSKLSFNATTGSLGLTDPSITGCILEDVYTITDAAAFEIDPSNGSVQLITLGANRTPKATNFISGESVTLMILDGSAYTLTWTDTTFGTSGMVWVGGTAPTLDTTKYTVLQLWKVGTQVYGAIVGVV